MRTLLSMLALVCWSSRDGRWVRDRRGAALLACLLLLLGGGLTGRVRATDYSYQQVFGKWSAADKTGYWTGYFAPLYGNTPNIIAANETYVVVGAPHAREQGAVSGDGAVQVFNAVTGAFVRKLLPPAPGVGLRYFGAACAIAGNRVAIGAPGPTSGSGKVYIFNLSNGALIQTVTPFAGVAGDLFGASLAYDGDFLVVGAPGESSARGSLYIINLKTGGPTKVLGEVNGDRFGISVAMEGSAVLVGAPFNDSNRGAAYLYRRDNIFTPKKIVPTASAASDLCGMCVVLQGGHAVLGAPNFNTAQGRIHDVNLITNVERVLVASDPGPGNYMGFHLSLNQGLLMAGNPYNSAGRLVYVFDLSSAATTEMARLTKPDVTSNGFALAAVWAGQTAVIAAPYDDAVASDNGCLYLIKPVTRPAPLVKVVAKGDYATGVMNATYGILGEAFINADGEASFSAVLAGAGSGGGKDSGVWTGLPASGLLDLSLKSRMADPTAPNPLVASVSGVNASDDERTLFRGKLTGPGVTSLDNQAIYVENGSALPTRLFRTGGGASAVFGGGVPVSFQELRVSRDSAHMALTFGLRQGVATTTAGTDSGLALYNLNTSLGETTVPREGYAAGATGMTYGQFTGRVSYMNSHCSYATAVAGAAAFNQAVFVKIFNGAEIKVARKGDLPATPGGVPFSAFLGESSDSVGVTTIRATLGAPATTANNEGLWRYAGGPLELVSRKGGDLPAALAGTRVVKYLRFYQTYGQTLAWVQLAGTGVTAANDQALLLFQATVPATGVNVLMREGDNAPGCGGARIGVISRVETEGYWGQYIVLATLTGAAAGTELALFQGSTHNYNAANATEEVFRRPVLGLRKGVLFDNQPGKLKSITFGNSVTPSGAGNVGLGRVIQEATNVNQQPPVIVTLEFVNGVRQVMKGRL